MNWTSVGFCYLNLEVTFSLIGATSQLDLFLSEFLLSPLKPQVHRIKLPAKPSPGYQQCYQSSSSPISKSIRFPRMGQTLSASKCHLLLKSWHPFLPLICLGGGGEVYLILKDPFQASPLGTVCFLKGRYFRVKPTHCLLSRAILIWNPVTMWAHQLRVTLHPEQNGLRIRGTVSLKPGSFRVRPSYSGNS